MQNKVLLGFENDFKIITNYYKILIEKTRNNEIIGSINEWIVDNYYIISEQEKYIRISFKNKNIAHIKNKRKLFIFNLINESLQKNDYKIDFNKMFISLNEYQDMNSDYFSYAEIDYIYFALRVVVIKELATLSLGLKDKLKIKEDLNKTFSLIGNKNFNKLINIKNKNIYYIEHLNYKLKELGDGAEEFFRELEVELKKQNTTVKDIIKKSHDEMAQDNLYMMNSINSLKSISKFKIETLYEKLSFTEKLLLNEKSDFYSKMFESSKYEYRFKIIKESKKIGVSEHDFVLKLVKVANENQVHVGWLLFKERKYDLRVGFYIFGIVLLTLVLTYYTYLFLGVGMLILGIIPISTVAIEIINKLINNFVHTKGLFKIELDEGLPIEYSTMVVIATIVKDKKKVYSMFDQLETYYLSNKTDNLYFTLLGDCQSADTASIDADDEIVSAGMRRVKELNEKYGKPIFNFVYRNRFYNEGEETFLGFERKRGALNHFNKLILGKFDQSEIEKWFKYQSFERLPKIKYVITLDTDTKLVLNTALKLVGTMIHPLNQPVLSEDNKKVIKGYGIMQPRVGIDVEVTDKSYYTQLFAGLGGLDIYTTAYSDVYQDTFNEGSFVGKGIYDLEIFETVMENTFPNNLILSHDLLEGNYLRCGLISDVELFDDYPGFYLADASRHHRWNRGDWQIISWLKNKVKNVNGETVRNPISILGKWKIFDNLRRSLVSVFLFAILLYGFSYGKENPLYYLLLDLIIISVPILFYLLSKIIYRNKYDRSLRYYLTLIQGVFSVIYKSFIVLALLPYETFLYLDSMIKALYRMYVSKKRLLNWIIAEEMERTLKNTLPSYLRAFKINYIASILVLILSYFYKDGHLMCAVLVSSIWIMAPFIIYYLGRPLKKKEDTLEDEEKLELKDIAFKTWRYFDDFMTEETNYLVPDNFQYNREEKADYKTSPTNIGYSLLAILSACELGFINEEKAFRKIEKTIKSIERLKKWNGHLYNWYDIYTLRELPPYFVSSVDNGNFIATLICVKEFAIKHGQCEIYHRIENLIEDMDFTKLYNYELDVFSVGYNDSEKVLLNYNYNNFASEARLTSFIAIAKGDAPYKHWFCLDKTLTKYKHYKGVASWSGTSFEYFMPLIFMKTYRHTLLDETYYYAFYAQKEFVGEIDSSLPWGISESAYNELDDAQNYKYNAFGIPYLKFQESAHYPIVISPYSSILAISIDDKEVYNNIQKLKDLNMIGEYGFYEAYDKDDDVIIKNHYAHHQGMILASLTNYLKDNVIQDYFFLDKNIASIEMLLKEKVQIKTFIDLKIAKYKRHNYVKESKESDIREFNDISVIPEMSVLSNGLYSIILNDRGDSFSKYKNLFINRYRTISDENYGMYFYIRNLKTKKVWSNTYAPLNTKPDKYKTIFASDRVKYIREDDEIITTTEITVVKDHNAEIRKLTFENQSNVDVELEVTSYGEVIIARNEEDVSHRTFNSLMINSEVDTKNKALIFSRKSKTKEDTRYFIINRLFSDNEDDSFSYETAREEFLGRNHNLSNPYVIANDRSLTNTCGSSIDPIMSIRKTIVVKANSKKNLYSVLGFGKSREQIYEIIDSYFDKFSIDTAFDLTTVLNNMRTSYANLSAKDINMYNRMLKTFYLPNNQNSFHKNLLKNNRLSQNDLWKFGVSGDLPIVFVEISSVEDLGFIKDILQAFEFYKSRTIYLDIVIINSEKTGKEEIISNYVNNLMYRINNLNYFENSVGTVYVISNNDITKEEKDLFKLVSRITLNASSGETLDEQLTLFNNGTVYVPKNNNYLINEDIAVPLNLDLNNSFGGFVKGGSEYMITTTDTPTPWSNIIANEKIGFVTTNSFGGFTYAFNSREFKITSWSNDITADPMSEMIKINGLIFTPKFVKHGFGYSKFYGFTEKYDIIITMFVAKVDPIKIYNIELINKTKETLSFDISFSCKLVLGVNEEETNRYLYSIFDTQENEVVVRNNYNRKHFNKDVFMKSSLKIEEFKNNPVFKEISTKLDLKPNSDVVFNFQLGVKEVTNSKYLNSKDTINEFEAVRNLWHEKLSVINVSTPDVYFNYLLNGFALYQVYASRLISKAGLYQVGGATGFRDQLQDVMSIIYSDQNRAKEQILFHANHQFKEGDVLHWWHEELMFGAKTRFSDDYLWLVYVTLEYIKITGDKNILKEKVRYITSDVLYDHENEKGVSYSYTDEYDTLYDRLILCINRALSLFGSHNIPLIGSGDWNDGFSKVGTDKKGESVFVGFFLYDLINKFIPYIKDEEIVDNYKERNKNLFTALNTNAWDGLWYLRAFFDNGEAMGSRNNTECQIDLLSQSWSIISEVATKEKIEKLIPNVEAFLVDKENKIIKLLTPGFKNSDNNPGYIMDYIVGMRENGGQYTHAAVWYILALIKIGKYEDAYKYYSMINPLNHTMDHEGVLKYKAEPYVIAADVYSNPLHLGRGGWSWYTGSASWYYKVGIEEILGFKKEGNKLFIDPKIPDSWDDFTIKYNYFNTEYNIEVINKKEYSKKTLDNIIVGSDYITLVDDGKRHKIVVEIGE